MYTRWDAPTVIPRILPADVELEGYRGIRVITPAAFVHRIPIVGRVLRSAERAAVDSPLRFFGGFLIAVLRKRRLAR